MTSTIFCIAGLGNPGPAYTLNRHNVGFMAIDEIAAYYNLGNWKNSPRYAILQGEIDSYKVILVKPMEYMNRSGSAISEITRFYKIPLDKTLVIHDDLDLALGRMKLKQGGGSGGHNGLKNLDQHCGSDYWRMRIGIGHPGVKEKVHDYVLSNFTKKEIEIVGPRLDDLCFAVPLWLAGKYEQCINKLGPSIEK